ncbi:MAG: transporter substrate-binding domain-containing protein [Arcobacter sp.]|uniref:transporter substrate-binding domain-containing protein n=1 Tax=Arcobacter sp. TaxID=1872629 RepID=UPI003D0576BE
MRLKTLFFLFLIFIFTLNSYAKNQEKKIKLQLQWKHQFEFAGFYMAKEKGFYKDLGVDVEFIEFDGKSNIMDEVLNENVQIGVWGSGLINEWLNGKDIVFLANYFKRSPLALITRPEIRTPEDLIGKRVMIPLSDASSASFQQMFKVFNISKDDLILVEPNFDIPNFEKDKIDATSTFLPNEPYHFIKNGLPYNILDPNNYGVEFYEVNLFTSKKFATQNPLLVKEFVEATNKGWDYALNNINESVNLILEKYNTQHKTKDALLFEANESKKFILQKNYSLGSIDIEKVRKIAELYIELGFAPKKDNLEDILFIKNPTTISLTKEEENFLKEHPTIKIASDKFYPPLDYIKNNKPTGYSIELIEILLKSLGFNVEFKIDGNWDNQIESFKKGELDILTSIFESNFYKENSILTNSYLKAQDVIIVRNGEDSIQNAYDLKGKIIALPKGYTYLELLKNKGINFTHLEVENMQEALEAVSDCKADATIESDAVMEYLMDKDSYVNLKKVYKIFDNRVGVYHDFHFAVNKEYPILAQMINKALENLSITQKRDLKGKWFDKKESQNIKTILLSDEEKKFIKENPIIKVSNETNFPPFDFTIGNQPYGFSIDILNLLSKKIGVKFEYETSDSWSQLYNDFKDKKIDLLHTLTKTPQRENDGIFSDPYIWYETHFVTRKENPEIKNIEELNGKILVVGKSWSSEEFISKNYPKIKLLVVDNFEEMLEAVSKGEAYAMIGENLMTRYFIKKKGFTNIKISSVFADFNSTERTSYRFLTSKDKPILNQLLNKGLNSLTLKELDELEEKWFGKYDITDKIDELNIKLDDDELSYLSKKKLIKMCVDPNWMPLERINENGFHEGMAADLIKKMSQKLNINIELIKTSSWEQSLEFAKNRECDILSLAMKTEERTKYLDFTSPYLSFPFVIATLHKELFIENIEQILDKEIALVKGYAYSEILKKRYPNKKFIEVTNIKEGLELLSEKKVFAFIDTLVSIGYEIQENNFYNIKIAGKLDVKWDLSLATRNDEPILNRIFQKGVNSILENDKQNAYNKWFSIKFEQSVDYMILWKIIVPIFILIFITIYWNRKLYNEKEKTKKALNSLKNLQDILEIKNFELEKMSNTDKLTNLHNRHKLDDSLKYELSRFHRTNIGFGLIILDIDFFKDVNDTFGHNIGDEVLIEICSVLNKNVRSSDILGRWGGEEFLIIVPNVTKEELEAFAEKLRKEIEEHHFFKVGKKTCSFGLTISKELDNENSIVSRADKALYKAKNKGRNRVEFL